MKPMGKKMSAFIAEMNEDHRVGLSIVNPTKASLIVMEMNKLITDNLIAIKNLAKQHGIKTICLFGSMAISDVSDNSDVDFWLSLNRDAICLI